MALLASMRPQEWVKNLLVFAGLIFSRQFDDSGALDILEGPRGFGAAMCNSPDFARTIDRPETFNIPDTTFKAYAACGHTFAAIDAALALRERHAIVPSAIARIDIASYAKALEVAGRTDPQTPFEARFSLPYCVAVTLDTGSARLDWQEQSNIYGREVPPPKGADK